jgi:pyrimidine-nucleoside phosphorylase
VQRALESGAALKKFQEMITLHGGDPRVCEDLSLLPRAARIFPVKAEASGYLTEMNAESLGITSVMLGAGRERKGDAVDLAVGFWMCKRLGEPLAEFHVNHRKNEEAAVRLFLDALTLGEEPPEALPLVAEDVQ